MPKLIWNLASTKQGYSKLFKYIINILYVSQTFYVAGASIAIIILEMRKLKDNYFE